MVCVFLPSYFFCFIKQSSKILNVKLSGKIPYWTWRKEGKEVVCKCAVQVFASTMLQIPERAEPRHCTLMQCTVKQHKRLAWLPWCRPSNFWCTGFVLAFYLSLLDKEWHCLSRYYASPAINMFWTPTLFKTKKLSEKRENLKAVKKPLLKFKCNSHLYSDKEIWTSNYGLQDLAATGIPFKPHLNQKLIKYIRVCFLVKLTLFCIVYKALSWALYFKHCLIQLWMVQSLKYQEFGLCRNLKMKKSSGDNMTLLPQKQIL